MVIKGLLATLLAVAVTASAQTPTQYEKDTRRLYDAIYKPIIFSVLACPDARYPNAAKRANCEAAAKAMGTRFHTKSIAHAEAMECARFHAGLLARNGVYRIVDDPAADPWAEWRCVTCNPTNNQEDAAKRSVRTFVVDQDGSVYDHRTRYFIPPFYAAQLGKINPRYAVKMWESRRGQITEILAEQK